MESLDFTQIATPSVIMLIAGSILSVLFNLIPRLNVWFAAKSKEYKQSFMTVAGFVLALVVVGLYCFASGAPCDLSAIVSYFVAVILYATGNQSTDRITPKPEAVRKAKTNGEVK